MAPARPLVQARRTAGLSFVVSAAGFQKLRTLSGLGPNSNQRDQLPTPNPYCLANSFRKDPILITLSFGVEVFVLHLVQLRSIGTRSKDNPFDRSHSYSWSVPGSRYSGRNPAAILRVRPGFGTHLVLPDGHRSESAVGSELRTHDGHGISVSISRTIYETSLWCSFSKHR
jgi:hypothetical protein